MAKKPTNDVKPTKENKMAEQSEGMLELDMNLADFEDFENLPKGEYPAFIKSAELRVSDKGSEYYYQVLTIDPKDFPVDYDVANAPEGLNLIYGRLFKPDPKNRRSMTAMKKWYKTLGLTLDTPIVDPAQWVDKRVKVVIGTGSWQGEERNEIKSIEALD